MNKLFANLDRRYAKICLYAGATVVLVVVTCYALHAALPVLTTLWQLVSAVLEPLVYGAALSYVLNPLVGRVAQLLGRWPRYANDALRRRTVAVAISVAVVVILLLALVSLMLLMITQSLVTLNWDTILSLFDTVSEDLTSYLSVAEERLRDLGFVTKNTSGGLLAAFSSVKDTATTTVFSVVFGVYLLIDGPRVSGYLGRVMRAALGDLSVVDMKRLLADADRVFSGYFRGQGIDALVVGVSAAIVLTAVGVPYGPVIGLLAGLGNLIPYVGGIVGFGSVVLMCLPEGQWTTMLLGLIGMGIVMFVDGNIINPRLLSENVQVHPILVVAALIAGGAVGGLAGMLVAVPTAAFLKIQLDRWLVERGA